jgi:RNA polymerase sigma-70 factor (ECF subfamily)
MSTASRAYLTIVPAVSGKPQTDRELVAALLARDPSAPVLAFRKYAPRIFGIVQRMLGGSSDAEDVTQDIFLRVFSRVHTLRDPDALSSFVLSVALRVIKWHLRQRRVRKILHLVERVPEISVPGLDIDARRTLRRFYEVLDTLPADERFVLALRHIEGMTLNEVADSAAISRSTAKRRLSKGAQRLARKVAADPSLALYSSRIISDVE